MGVNYIVGLGKYCIKKKNPLNIDQDLFDKYVISELIILLYHTKKALLGKLSIHKSA